MTNTSPPASPPRKRLETVTSAEVLDLDDMEIKVEKELSMSFFSTEKDQRARNSRFCSFGGEKKGRGA